jgi:PAS domain S-box-containing protein
MWLAMFVAKLVTRPVAALAEATQEISRGNLDYRVAIRAADELGDLIAKFNRMAAELDSNRRQLEASQQDLKKANAQLEQRRQQIETILENIPTGVLSLSPEQEIIHANLAFTRMLAPRVRATLTRTTLAEHLPPDVVDDLSKLMRKADRMGSSTVQMELAMSRGRMHAAVTVASLNHDGQRLGYVVVVEDLSDLLKAQRQAAWREVARRVAHEIKNPLTPIALSAQRIRRHIDRTGDSASLSVIRSCIDTIAGSVETVRALVDEFATLARFPVAQPQLSSINSVIENALAMFNGRLDGIAVQTFFAPDVPRIMVDPEAMKRAIANLVDNAAEAMAGSTLKEIHVSTALLADREAVEIVVADTGHGVTADAKERLFLPYFSTKGRGSGLGLAIVSRVVEEHHGSIRVEENKPLGSRFVIELPVISEAAAVARA